MTHDNGSNPGNPLVLDDADTREWEFVVVANLLTSPALADTCGSLRGEDFHNPRLGRAYELICEAGEDHLQSLMDEGWRASELSELSDYAMVPTMTGVYAARLVEAATTRRIHVNLGEVMADVVSDPLGDPAARVEKIQDKLQEVSPQKPAVSVPLENALQSLFKELDDADDVVPTGWPALDDRIRGWPKGTLAIVGARPGQGKSAFCLAAALRLAKRGIPSLYLGFEDRKEQYARRLLAMEARIDQHVLTYTGIRASAEYIRHKMIATAEKLRSLPVHLADVPLHAREIGVAVRQHIRQHDVQVVFVDHIQEIQAEGTEVRDNRTYEIQAITQKLRDVAKQTGICMVAACQINRDAEKSERPKVWHLRDSGSLEMIARLILLLYRNDSILEVAVGKANHGPSGDPPVELGWDGACCRVHDLAGDYA